MWLEAIRHVFLKYLAFFIGMALMFGIGGTIKAFGAEAPPSHLTPLYNQTQEQPPEQSGEKEAIVGQRVWGLVLAAVLFDECRQRHKTNNLAEATDLKMAAGAIAHFTGYTKEEFMIVVRRAQIFGHAVAVSNPKFGKDYCEGMLEGYRELTKKKPTGPKMQT